MAKYRVTFISSADVNTRHANRCRFVATPSGTTPILPVGVTFQDSGNEAWAGYDFEGGYRGTAGWANDNSTDSFWGIVDFGDEDPYIEEINWQAQNIPARAPDEFTVERYNTETAQWDELIHPTGVSWSSGYEHKWWTLQAGGVTEILQISGVVELDGSPVAATLRAYRTDTGALVEEVTSSPSTGAYVFGDDAPGLPAGVDLFVLCHYGTNVRPLAHGPVTPELVAI